MTEDDLLELLTAFAPETLEGWLALAVVACAVISFAVPAPSENAHPLWKISHRVIGVFGMGAGKMRAAGKIGKLGRLASLFGRKK